MRLASLGSGSRGNATVVESGQTRVMVDCGFSLAETERRLARVEVDGTSLTAILVTHEHSDHLNGVAKLARRYNLPVWMTPGTHAVWAQRDSVDQVELFSPHEAFAVQDLEILPYPVPHDAREPCQFVISDGVHRLGILSDAGRVTPHIRECIDACDALFLECNHDPEMLSLGPYPASIKRRVGGDLGHLSNNQAATLLASLDTSTLQHIIVAHLSENNNRMALAQAALADALNCTPDWIGAAYQKTGLAWRTITNS